MSVNEKRKTADSLAASEKKHRVEDPLAYNPTTFVAPDDWPKPGSLDLNVHDLPHRSSETEWWYVSGHFKDSKGKEYSFFASFFRIIKRVHADGSLAHSHCVIWAISDPDAKKYYYQPLLDYDSPADVSELLNNENLDSRLKRAFKEVCDKKNVPLPDVMMHGPAVVATDKLDLNYGGTTLVKLPGDAGYRAHIENRDKTIMFDLDFKPTKKPIRHGTDGVVKIGLKADTMFYYFIPRCTAKATMLLNGERSELTGTIWYDHEFGGNCRQNKYENPEMCPPDYRDGATKSTTGHYAWNWLAVQLEDGTDLSATTLIHSESSEIYDNFVITIDPDSNRTHHPDAMFKSTQSWLSTRTTFDYPSKWVLDVPSADIHLNIDAAFEDQEFVTLISRPAFWEGRMNVTGTIKGKPVKGLAFLERHGFENLASLDRFYKKVSKMVLSEIANIFPLEPSYENSRRLIADEKSDHYMEGANLKVFTDTVIKPLRDIIDRGGKSWRSFSMLLCVDCVGGYSPKYKHWLAMPEIMHAGSLIVDDIQDKSETRRGGPSCHKLYGDAIAINAGSAAYFMSMQILQQMTPDMSEDLRLKLYEHYFLTLRAGHAGQAFDINGVDYMMDEIVETGHGALLEERVKCTHRLKSAAPAGNLARMGVYMGGGTFEQAEALGRYFESIGVAFQIIDDVLNLRGFEGKTKTRGEDINAGKVTYPVAKGMSRLDKEKRREIWNIIKSKPQEQKLVDYVIDTLEGCGAIEASVQESSEMVDAAWKIVDNAIPDSFHKLLLRAFGWYVLERHY